MLSAPQLLRFLLSLIVPLAPSTMVAAQIRQQAGSVAVSKTFTRTASCTCYVNNLQRRIVHINAPFIAQRLFIISYMLMLMLLSVRCCFINQTDHGHNQSYTLQLRSQHSIYTGLLSNGPATPPVNCGKERVNRPYKMILYLISTLLMAGDIQPNPECFR